VQVPNFAPSSAQLNFASGWSALNMNEAVVEFVGPIGPVAIVVLGGVSLVAAGAATTAETSDSTRTAALIGLPVR
jgi:hypothetical protein